MNDSDQNNSDLERLPLEEIFHAHDKFHKELFSDDKNLSLSFLGLDTTGARITEKNIELVKTITLNVDLTYEIEYPDGYKEIIHIEFERKTQRQNPMRVAEYQGIMRSSNAEKRETGEIVSLPNIRTFIIYTFPGSGQSDPGEYVQYDHGGKMRSYTAYDKVYLYEKTLQDVIDHEFWSLLALSPFLKGVKDTDIPRVQELIYKNIKDPERLSRALFHLAFYFKKCYGESIVNILPNFDAMAEQQATALERERLVWKEEGKKEGKKEGAHMLVEYTKKIHQLIQDDSNISIEEACGMISGMSEAMREEVIDLMKAIH
ncbi:hypothetical protein HON22_02910 [Candidatus Peregrinibacteria bacterium]|jgi:hypothetical protein|nr:hypothetical protein [Candidatus Peregrinibacteria bacterium]